MTKVHQQLNGKQRAFIRHYLGKDPVLHGNATRSYKAAYGKNLPTQSAAVMGSKLLKNPLVADLVSKATARLNEQLIVDAGFVLQESKRLYDRAMGDEPVTSQARVTVDPKTGEEIVEVEQVMQYDPQTARQALRMIGDHKSVQAFSVNVEHSHTHHLEQRLAARSKAIEGKAHAIERDPLLIPGDRPTDPAPTDDQVDQLQRVAGGSSD